MQAFVVGSHLKLVRGIFTHIFLLITHNIVHKKFNHLISVNLLYPAYIFHEPGL